MEVPRLREFGEVNIPDDVALKLKRIGSATNDRKLKHQKEVLHPLRSKGGTKPGSLLKRKIPVRLGDWDTSQLGHLKADMVVHCGLSTLGEYVNTLNTTEISSGWRKGEAILGRSQEDSFWALKETRKRIPFEWKGLGSDNGQEFIN